jgi:hypothetical protein
MPRLVLFAALVALAACGNHVALTASELRAGQNSLAVRGTLLVASGPEPFDLVLDGVACERLGWINLYDAPPRSVVVFDPQVGGLAVGTYTMGSSESVSRGWLNTSRAPSSVMTLRGTTRLTSVTPDEVAGVVDWVIGLHGDTVRGMLILRGAFRALRTGDACMPKKRS